MAGCAAIVVLCLGFGDSPDPSKPAQQQQHLGAYAETFCCPALTMALLLARGFSLRPPMWQHQQQLQIQLGS
jgi:hypothetical protein